MPATRRVASFKVSGKGFLGVEASECTITLSLGEPEARALDARYPGWFEEIWRMGRALAGIRVDLSRVPPELVIELIERSRRHRAPRRVVAEYDAGARGQPVQVAGGHGPAATGHFPPSPDRLSRVSAGR